MQEASSTEFGRSYHEGSIESDDSGERDNLFLGSPIPAVISQEESLEADDDNNENDIMKSFQSSQAEINKTAVLVGSLTKETRGELLHLLESIDDTGEKEEDKRISQVGTLYIEEEVGEW